MIQAFVSFRNKTPSAAGEDNVILRRADELQARLNFIT